MRGNKARLQKLGIKLRRDELQASLRNGCVVLVELIRHATALQQELPGWTVEHALPEQELSATSDATAPPASQVGTIVTLVRAARDGISAGVLVRATGGRGRLRCNFDIGAGIKVDADLIIDLSDCSDKIATQETNSRIDDYFQQGLEVIDSTANWIQSL